MIHVQIQLGFVGLGYETQLQHTLYPMQPRGPFYYHSRSQIAHLNMLIVKIGRVGQSAHILTIHVK